MKLKMDQWLSDEADEKHSKGISVTPNPEGEEAPDTDRMADAEGTVWADCTVRDPLFMLSIDVLKAFKVQDFELRHTPRYFLRTSSLAIRSLIIPV